MIRTTFLFLVLILAGATTVFGQTFTDSGITLDGIRYASASWGDYDNDGDLDLAVTGDSLNGYASSIFKNTGGAFTNINAALTNAAAGDLKWGDYDNDGDLDLAIIGNRTASVRMTHIYRNDGADTFTNINVTFPSLSASSLAWGDYDNDGDLDIVIGGFGNAAGDSTIIYRNEGSDTFVDIEAGLEGLHYTSFDWGDYDNDGDLDLAQNGYDNDTDTRFTRIYKNTDGVFADGGFGFTGLAVGDIMFGDYDADGDLDLVVSGYAPGVNAKTIVYRNNGNETFTDVSAGLEGLLYSATAWGDYDNDGDLDLAIAGQNNGAVRVSNIYRNDGSDTFTDIDAAIDSVQYAALAWGDYDGDNKLDLALLGATASGLSFKIYDNGTATANTAPATPGNTSATGTAVGTATFNWDAATDTETAAAGLTYNLRIGTTAGGSEIMSAHADDATGFRIISDEGNVGNNISITIEGLLADTYYWTVQAVDGAFEGSAFATEGTVVVTGDPLAVEVINFRALQEDDAVVLNWESVADTPSHFIVEQFSADVNAKSLDLENMSTYAGQHALTLKGLSAGEHTFRLSWIDQNGVRSAGPETTIDVSPAAGFFVSDVYPNPFNPQAQISFYVTQSQQITVNIYDVTGRKVATLMNELVSGNENRQLQIDGSNLPSGLYIVRVSGEYFSQTRSVSLLK